MREASDWETRTRREGPARRVEVIAEDLLKINVVAPIKDQQYQTSRKMVSYYLCCER